MDKTAAFHQYGRYLCRGGRGRLLPPPHQKQKTLTRLTLTFVGVCFGLVAPSPRKPKQAPDPTFLCLCLVLPRRHDAFTRRSATTRSPALTNTSTRKNFPRDVIFMLQQSSGLHPRLISTTRSEWGQKMQVVITLFLDKRRYCIVRSGHSTVSTCILQLLHYPSGALPPPPPRGMTGPPLSFSSVVSLVFSLSLSLSLLTALSLCRTK